MANLQYSQDIKAYALDNADEKTDGSSEFDSQAELYINQHYQGVWLGGRELDPQIDENWWWLRKPAPGTLALRPAITDGTVKVTNGDPVVTFSQAPATSVEGFWFRVVGTAETYRVASHTGGQANATLDTIYTSADQDPANYRLIQVEYQLASDVLRVVSPMRVGAQNTNYFPYKIHGIALDRMLQEWPMNIIHLGIPELFAVIAQDSTTYTVRFNRYGSETPNQFIRVEYDYQFKPALLADFSPAGTEEPVVPWEWRRILADATTFDLLTHKRDDRAAVFLQRAQAGLRDMAKENRYKRVTMSTETGRIHPREWSKYNRVLRTETGLIIG